MKKISKAILFGLAFLGVGAITACNENKVDETTQVAETAIEKILLPQNDTKVTGDFEVPTTVKYNGEKVNITWTSSKEVISFKTVDGKTTAVVDYINNRTAEQEVVLTATIKVGDVNASTTFMVTVPKFTVNTIAEADAAASKANLTLKGVIVAKEAYNASGKKTNVYLKSEDGGFEAYNLTCASKDMYDSELAVGNTIYVSGPKSYYNGLRELSGCTYIYDANTAKQEVTAENLTDKIGDITEAYQCHLAKLENVEILSIGTPDSTGQYSITVANPDDSAKEAVVRISKYFFTGKTATDYAFKDLNLIVGQKITVTGFVGWYNGAQVTPIAADGIVAGQINYAKVLGTTLLEKLTLPEKVYGVKTFTLPSSTVEAELTTDEGYAAYTVEWTENSENTKIDPKTVAEVPETDTTTKVPGYTTNTLTTTKVTADEEVTLTLNVKDADGTVVFTKTVKVTLVSNYIPDTHADYVAAEENAEITVEGTVAYIYKKDNKATFTLVDADGAYLVRDLTLSDTDADKVVLGMKLAVSGNIKFDNNLIYVDKGSILNDAESTAVEAATITELPTVTKEIQSKLVTFTGVVKKSGKNFVVTVGTGDAAKDIACYVTSAEYTDHNDMIPIVGSKVTVTGLLSIHKETSQIVVYNTTDVVDNTTEDEKLDLAINTIQAQFTNAVKMKEVTTLSKLFGDKETITITSADDADKGVTLDKTKLTVTVDPKSNTEVTYELKVTVTMGSKSKDATISVKIQKDDSISKIELVFPTATTNLTEGNTTSVIYGTTTDVVVNYTKNNKSNTSNATTDMVKLYQDDVLTFTAGSNKKIYRIEVETSGNETASYGWGKLAVTVGDETVSNSDGTSGDKTATYIVNGTTITFTATAQVRFKKIIIYVYDAE